MNILLVSQYFWPESFLINDLVRMLKRQGNNITVLTGKPNYPDGEIFDGFAEHGFTHEVFEDGIDLYRLPTRPRKNGGAKNLLLNYLSFAWNGIIDSGKVTKKVGSCDVVFVYMPSPITSVLPAIALKWRMKSHLVVWVQDLWPESIKATGFVKNPFALWLVGLLVRFVYACTDCLLVQSRSFIAPVSRYVDEKKIIYYPNSYLISKKHPSDEVVIPDELLNDISNNFSLVFAGNLGEAQSLHTLIEVASRMSNLPDCRLVLVGSGSRLDWLREQKQKKKLDNLLLPGRFPPEAMPVFFDLADCLLVTLNAEEIFSYTVPSKVQTYLAAGKPIIAAMDGEGARLINEAGAGLTCAAEDVDGLVHNIESLYNMSDSEKAEMGLSGRRYFDENFDMEKQSRRLIDIIQNRICGTER